MTIWAVELADDGNALLATLVRSFNVYGWEQDGSPCIYGDRLLRGRDDTQFLEVFDWARCTSKRHWKAVVRPVSYVDVGSILSNTLQADRAVCQSWAAVRLLPKGRILAIAPACVAIFQPDELGNVARRVRAKDLQPAQPSWSYRLDGTSGYDTFAVSPQFRYHSTFPESVDFSMYKSGVVYFCRVGGSNPTITSRVVSRHESRLGYLGWRGGILRSFSSKGAPAVMRFLGRADPVDAWEVQGVTVSSFSFGREIGGGLWFYDEQSGRLLVDTTETGHRFCAMYFV